MKQISHPMWGFLHYVATLFAAGFAMYLFATEFDETEMKALGVFASVLGVGDFIKSRLTKKQSENDA